MVRWSPLEGNDDHSDHGEYDHDLPPMEPIHDNNAVAKILAYGALGITICISLGLMVSALMPALK